MRRRSGACSRLVSSPAGSGLGRIASARFVLLGGGLFAGGLICGFMLGGERQFVPQPAIVGSLDIMKRPYVKETVVESVDIMKRPYVKETVDDLFGSEMGLLKFSKEWGERVHSGATSLSPAKQDSDVLRAGLVNYLRILEHTIGFNGPANPFHSAPGEMSVARSSINRFNEIASGMNGSWDSCVETGDGHFLRTYYTACVLKLSVDKFDPKADLKLDLDNPIDVSSCPAAVRQVLNTVDLVVSHQVFEHIVHPTIGIANLNALLRIDGTLVFSTPFLIQEHGSPSDFSRYSVNSVRKLLECAGFQLELLHGQGNRLQVVSYLLEVPRSQISESEANSFCDGLKSQDCNGKFYSTVAALARKVKAVPAQTVRSCYG